MTTGGEDREYELSIEALRAETTHADKARVRERLVSKGVIVGAATVVAAGGAATAAGAAQAAPLAARVVTSWTTKLVTGAVLGATLLVAVPALIAHRSASPQVQPTRKTGHVPRSNEAPAPRPEAPQVTAEAKLGEVAIPEPREARVVTARGTRKQSTRLRATGLQRENALLSAAARAIRAGKRQEAERLLDRHAREFPAGFLAAEREIARTRIGELTGTR